MKKIIEIISKISNIVIALAFIFVLAALIFFYTFPFNVAEFKKINIVKAPNAGELLEYNLDFCRYVPKGTEIEVKRFIVPKDKTLTNPIELSSNPSLETLDGIIGCRLSEPIKIPIDISAPSGEYRLLIRAKYCIEMLFLHRCIPVEQYSDYFSVGQPNIPTRLSVISEQLDDIRRYVEQNPSETSVGNAFIQPDTPPEPSVPEVNQPTQSGQRRVQQETQGQRPEGIVNATLDTTQNTVNGIFNLLGGK